MVSKMYDFKGEMLQCALEHIESASYLSKEFLTPKEQDFKNSSVFLSIFFKMLKLNTKIIRLRQPLIIGPYLVIDLIWLVSKQPKKRD